MAHMVGGIIFLLGGAGDNGPFEPQGGGLFQAGVGAADGADFPGQADLAKPHQLRWKRFI